MSKKTKPATSPVKPRKLARKRDASRLYPDTPIGRVINLTPSGLLHFAEAPVLSNDAVHYHLAHPRIGKKRLMRENGLSSRMANTIIRDVRGMKAGNAENQLNRIEATEAHIAKTEEKLAKAKKAGRRTGNLKDKIKRLNERLTCQKAEAGKHSIFFGREEYRHQPINTDYDDPQVFAAAYNKFRQDYEQARYGRFGCIGSHEEQYGNQTYQMRADVASKVGLYYHVPIFHSREQLADLRLSEKDYNKLVEHQATREAVTVDFIRNRNHWMAHASLMRVGAEPYVALNCTLAVDINDKCLSWVLFKLETGQLSIVKYDEISIPKGSTARRETALRKALAYLSGIAVEYKATLAFENLDLRRKKAKDNGTRMNTVLHGLPYAKVMTMSSRLCRIKGIPVRYVNPGFTSIVGGVFTAKFPYLNRDQGACLPIGLLATEDGRKHLNALSRQMLATGGKYRTSVKGEKNLTADLVQATGGSNTCMSTTGGEGRQSTAPSRSNLDDFYTLGKQLKTTTETLFAVSRLAKHVPKSKRKRPGPVRECHWLVSAGLKSPGGGRVMHELAAGSLNVLNPVNVWLHNTPVLQEFL